MIVKQNVPLIKNLFVKSHLTIKEFVNGNKNIALKQKQTQWQ